MSNTSDNPIDIIVHSLEEYGGKQQTVGDSRMVLCPYHDDAKTPSLSVFMAEGMSIPLGFFHCLGCGAKGHWNKLADTIGASHIKQWLNIESANGSFINNEVERDLLDVEYHNLRSLLRTLGDPPTHPWPRHMEWRGYKGHLLRKVGGLMFEDSKNLTEEADPSLMMFFPVYVNNKVVGGVRAYLQKQPWRTSYLTTRGDWVKTDGLLFYDFVKRMIKKKGYSFVILVEGPRDALRLIRAGLPSIAVLGANTFSEKKARKIMALNIDIVYIMPDNDRGGDDLEQNILEGINNMIRTRRISLPRDTNKNGELIKMDPDSAPPRLIRRVKKLLTD
jgi:5S rRNA maturation endonuclease (ribonuclease M5)